MFVFSVLFDRTAVPFSCFLISDGSLHSWKNSGSSQQCSLEQAITSKQLTVLDQNRFLYTAAAFQERWNFPNVIGCTDWKYIRIKCPSKHGSSPIHNYSFFIASTRRRRFWKQSHFCRHTQVPMVSKVLLHFLLSAFYHFLADSESTLPKPAISEGRGAETPFVILGDEAYGLQTNSTQPFARKYLSCGK